VTPPQFPSRQLAPAPIDVVRVARLEAEVAAARAALERAAVLEPAGDVPRDLLRVAADELRTPATAISGYLELMLHGNAGPLEPELEHMLECAVYHTRRMIEMVDDLVLIGNLTGRPTRYSTVDIASLVRGRALDAAGRAVARQVRLDLRLADCPPVRGDAAILGRALECLLDQAITFSPPSSTVVCALSSVAGEAVVEVSDDDATPDTASLDALLDGRRPATPDDPRTLLASRLGLALVRMVCQAHGGRAEAVAGSGQTTVRMVLPVVG
jgi:signal transduction histidine kinase